MASEKFTPGPWYCIPEGTDEVTVFIFSEKGFEADASRDEETVAAVDCHLKADYPQDTWEIDGETRDANACLIVAAPEMYAMLQDIAKSGHRAEEINRLLEKARGENKE